MEVERVDRVPEEACAVGVEPFTGRYSPPNAAFELEVYVVDFVRAFCAVGEVSWEVHLVDV